MKILTKQQRCWRVVKRWSQGPNFDHFAWSEGSLQSKRRITEKWSHKYQSMPIFNRKTLLRNIYEYISIYYLMLSYPVLIINKLQVKIIIWSEDGHIAHLFDNHILTWSRTCAWSLITTVLSYNAQYNDKLTTWWSLKINCNIQNSPLCMTTHTFAI